MKPETVEWIEKADADYAAALHARSNTAHPHHDLVVFLSPQRVKKLLKAALSERGIVFRRTHDLIELAVQLAAIVPDWAFLREDLTVLQPGAVMVRYPGIKSSDEDALTAVAACARLRQGLLALLQPRQDGP